jgi:hypothetical protein
MCTTFLTFNTLTGVMAVYCKLKLIIDKKRVKNKHELPGGLDLSTVIILFFLSVIPRMPVT